MPHNFISASIKVQDASRNILLQKSSIRESTFQIENILFSLKVNQKYGIVTIFLFLVHIILITVFLFYLIGLEPPTYNNPIQSSIVKSRIIINCLMLVGTALFIKTFGYYTNSATYDLSLFIAPHFFNSTYFFVGWWKKFNRIKFPSISRKNTLSISSVSGSVVFTVSMVFFFVVIPVVIVALNIVSNERVLGIPALHFQKVIIILAYFVFASETISQKTKELVHEAKPRLIFDQVGVLLPKNFLIISFSLILSILTGDYGSTLFVAIAIIMIEITLRRVQLTSLLFKLGLFFGFLLLLNQIGIFDYRKFYRLLYSFLPPDADSFTHFNQADRESLSYIWFNLQSFMESFHTGLFNDLKILEVSKSVAHSDYAFHWSLMLGGVPFLILILICLSFLLTHLFFIFKSTLIPMKVGRNTFLSLVNNKYTVIISFWLAITIVQFIYQLFSNNMLFGSILSGIPFPFISVGRGDYLFITILVVGLEILFYSNSFKADLSKKKLKAVSSNFVFNNSFKQAQFVLLVFLLSFGLKGAQFWYLDKQEINISPNNLSSSKEDEIIVDAANFSLMNQKKYIQLAQDEIAETELTNLPIKIKQQLKPLQYAYYNAKPIKAVIKIPFELKQERLEEIISWDNHFNFGRREISGKNKPFGEVFVQKVLVNDSYETILSNPFYQYLNLNNDDLNLDLSAELNRLLTSHVKTKMPKNTKASIIVLNNKTNEYVATSQYPNNTDDFVYYQNYYIGSIKKAILLDAALSIDFERYNNFESQGLTLGQWIKYSNYDFAGELLKNILNYNFEKFDRYLSEEYGLPFYSVSTQSYSDRPIGEMINIPLLANGGLQKYPIVNVLQWYRKLVHEVNEERAKASRLKNVLNLPLLPNGTASVVGKELRQSGLNLDQFIAKTGTLEEDGKNISSSFIIANQKYTVGVMMTGDDLSSNRTGLTAKYLFANEVLPLLTKYSVF